MPRRKDFYMNNKPLVSIVIRNYNYAQFLQKCIDSALSQSYHSIEVIVVDDGSTDHSRQVISNYGDRVAAIFQENGGEESSCCSGFRASRGKIVIFLDADDMLRPGAAQAVVNAWTESTSKVQFYLDWVDKSDRPLGKRWPSFSMPRGDVMRFIRIYGFYPSPPTTGNAFARFFLDEVLPTSNGPWTRHIDTYLIALAPLYGEVTSLDQSLGYYRVHGKNMSGVGLDIDVLRIRRRLNYVFRAEDALRDHALRLGCPLFGPLALNVPQHCKARLLSLLIDRTGHPFPEDRAWRLVAAGVKSTWRYPHFSLWKRIYSTAGFPVFVLLPRPWIRGILPYLMNANSRRQWLQKALRNGSRADSKGGITLLMYQEPLSEEWFALVLFLS